MYEVKARNWWIPNPDWPDGREPGATPWDEADFIGYATTEAEAQRMCREFNESHDPGPLSYKAEYDRVLYR